MWSWLFLINLIVILNNINASWPLDDGYIRYQQSPSILRIVAVKANANANFNDSVKKAIEDLEKFIVQQKTNQAIPSVSYGIQINGKSVFRKSWGMKDLENQLPANLDTRYRLASISKTFTAVMIGLLVDQGKLHFDDDLHRHLPESVYPRKKWNITIGQLLSHTAGTHSTILTDFNNITLAHNCTQMIHKFSHEPLHFKPGTQFLYSNYGFQLLGAVIESITGKSYSTVMNEFFHQNGLRKTLVDTSDALIFNRARDYSTFKVNNSETLTFPVPVWDDVFVTGEHYSPSGGLVSTVDDLLRWGQLMLDCYHNKPGAILRKETLTQLWTSRTDKIPNFPYYPSADYGYGWFIGHIPVSININLKYRHFMWHSGGLLGTSTILIIYPEQNMVGAVLANKGYAVNLDAMVIEAAERLYPLIGQ